MPLINYEVSLQLIWSKKCFLAAVTAADQEPKFKITDTKRFIPVVALSTKDDVKLLK